MLAADPKGTTCALAPKAVRLNKESNSFFIFVSLFMTKIEKVLQIQKSIFYNITHKFIRNKLIAHSRQHQFYFFVFIAF
jgi:hypothetical protein